MELFCCVCVYVDGVFVVLLYGSCVLLCLCGLIPINVLLCFCGYILLMTFEFYETNPGLLKVSDF